MALVEVNMMVIDAATGAVTYQAVMDEQDDPGPEPVPQSISRFQARVALMDAGLLAGVELAIADADPLTQLAWAEATEWRRDSPSIAAIGAAIRLTDEDIDNLFIEASKIKA